MNVVPPLVIALVILASAAVAMALRNLIHSALLLIVSWFGIALFYLWAGAEFVAFAQVLIYVGAVSMVVLFAVLLTRRSRADLALSPGSIGRAGSALMAGAAVAGLLAWAVVHTRVEMGTGTAPAVSVRRIGTLLMGPQAASLLVIGVLLTVALIGAVVLASSKVERVVPNALGDVAGRTSALGTTRSTLDAAGPKEAP